MENTNLPAEFSSLESTYHLLETETANPFSYRSGHHVISVEGHIIESHPSSAATSGDPSQRAQSIFGLWSIFSLLVVLFTHS